MPIFVAADSADVWAHPELFLLDKCRRPKVVAGVPPDYFSARPANFRATRSTTGTRIASRLRLVDRPAAGALELVDLVRLDHFRGFGGAWQVPYGETDRRERRMGARPGSRPVPTPRGEV